MVNEVSVRFLGTSSQTNVSRNYSSLLVKLDHQTAMIDCGESTQRQLLNRHVGGEEKLANIRHIFITHLHADHVLGLVPLLCTMMGPSTGSAKPDRSRPRVEIYGPSGLRALIRTTLTLCYTTLTGSYTVHELLWPSQSAYPSEAIVSPDVGVVSASIPESSAPLLGAMNGPPRTIPHLPPLESELPGMDFRLDEATVSWPSIASIAGVTVSAAPILHRCPAVGYVFEEPASASVGITPAMIHAVDANAATLESKYNFKNPRSLLGKLTKDRQGITLPDGTVLEPPALDVQGRKVVILGDTYDATAGLDGAGSSDAPALDSQSTRGMAALAQDADVLVHECTNAALPGALLPGRQAADERRDEVRAKALVRGHSTPQVAGQFAARCGARQLLLNHFSTKYPAPHPMFKMGTDEGMGDESFDSAKIRAGPKRKTLTMREIERQATEAWHSGLKGKRSAHRSLALKASAIATFDGFMYRVPARNESEAGSNGHAGHYADRSTGGASVDSFASSNDRSSLPGNNGHRPVRQSGPSSGSGSSSRGARRSGGQSNTRRGRYSMSSS